MRLLPSVHDTECYLRLLANWGLGLAGLPMALDSQESPAAARAAPTAKPLSAS